MARQEPIHITDGFLTIAAVVTGGQTAHLTGWQRRDAITAMRALGHRAERIEQALKLSRHRLQQLTAEMGISLADPDNDPDEYAIDIACQGTPMRLHPADREQAVRRLAPRHTTKTIARLIGCSPALVTRLAGQLGVHPKPAQVPWHEPARQHANAA